MATMYCIGGPDHGKPVNFIRKRDGSRIGVSPYSIWSFEHAGPDGLVESRVFAVESNMDEDEAQQYAIDMWARGLPTDVRR